MNESINDDLTKDKEILRMREYIEIIAMHWTHPYRYPSHQAPPLSRMMR